MGLRPVIATFKYEPDFDSDLASRKGDFALPEGASAINIYRSMRKSFIADPDADWSRAEDESDEGLSVSSSGPESARRLDYFDDRGRLVKHRMTKNGRSTKTVFYENGIASRQRDYEDTGACGRERTLDPATGRTTEERYFTPDGFCYVTRHLDSHSDRQFGVYTHDRETGTSRRFAHNTPWHADWLTSLFKAEESRPYAIAQHPTAMTKLLDTDPSLSSRLFLAHVNLFQPPYTLGSPLRTDYVKPYSRVDEMPVVLSLTEAQAADMRSTFGADRCDPVVIPNVMRDRRTSTDIPKERRTVGIACRLHPEQKRVDDLLRAWAHVIQAVPDAHLKIGGDGAARSDLEKLARDLKIEDSVSFLGWLDDSVDLMASCTLTVSVARWEGLPLAIGESLAAETPVVAYDINYGPSDLIRDGVDGRLVSNGDTKELARAMIDLLKHERQAARMGRRGARRIADEFSLESVIPRWASALELADQRS
jgi:glycosyltransferase involved in cell wall biosynthesis